MLGQYRTFETRSTFPNGACRGTKQFWTYTCQSWTYTSTCLALGPILWLWKFRLVCLRHDRISQNYRCNRRGAKKCCNLAGFCGLAFVAQVHATASMCSRVPEPYDRVPCALKGCAGLGRYAAPSAIDLCLVRKSAGIIKKIIVAKLLGGRFGQTFPVQQ